MIFDSLVPCRRLIFAVVLPVAPAPAECASSTVTLLPALASNTAVTSPVMPAPTTTMSALRSASNRGLGGDGSLARSASHNEVMAQPVPCVAVIKRTHSKAWWGNAFKRAAHGVSERYPATTGLWFGPL